MKLESTSLNHGDSESSVCGTMNSALASGTASGSLATPSASGSNGVGNGSTNCLPVNRKRSNGFLMNGSTNKFSAPFKAQRDIRDSSLPVLRVADQFLEHFRANDVCIIVGETGCGKSTQIPQIFFDNNLHIDPSTGKALKIAVTQPRRLAAVSLARRVAEERHKRILQEVGYKFRFKDFTSADTFIDYLTDGTLLNESMNDPFLSKYAVVIIDEAHERTVDTDTLLMMLKHVKRKEKTRRSPLKVVIMSATIEAEKFSSFFDNAKVFAVSGRSHATHLYYLPVSSLNDVNLVSKCVKCALQLHGTEPLSDGFLVFLPTYDDINSAVAQMKKALVSAKLPFIALPLYSSLSFKKQMEVYPCRPNIRKIIFATNIAETSVTIPGVRIVIDSGKVKQRYYVKNSVVEIAEVRNISQAHAAQRAGRAGREAPGKCYRLYSVDEYNKMDKMPVPEILRCSLTSLMLKFYKVGMRQFKMLKFIDEPPKDQMLDAHNQLLQAELISQVEDGRFKLTEKGELVANFPIEPVYCNMLFCAQSNNCTSEMITVLAFLSSDPIFTVDPEDCDNRVSREFFNTTDGDFVRMCRIYELYKSNKDSGKQDWFRYGINEQRLNYVHEARTQLRELARNNGIQITSCHSNYKPINKSVAQALPWRTATYDKSRNAYRVNVAKPLYCKIHPSSTLHNVRANAIVFCQLTKTTETYAKDVAIIDPTWVNWVNQ